LNNNFLLAQALLSSKKFIGDKFLDKLVFEKSFILDRLEEVHTLFVVLSEFDILEPNNCFAWV
jgi:hypothetical protein